MSGPWIPTPERLWFGPPGSLGIRVAQALLQPLSLAYAGAAALHRHAYASGLLSSSRGPVRVVAVGNIVAGGAGKTPVVLALAQEAARRGLPCAVVSRGYGGHPPAAGVRVEPETSAVVAGDEAVLLARRLGKTPVYAGRDRAALTRRAADEGARVVILDDGMQHRRLAWDALVAVVRLPRPLGNGRLLPAGPLREPAAALARADLVVALGTLDEGSRTQLAACGVELDRVVEARLAPLELVPLGPGEALPASWLDGRVVAAAAGIGRPLAFRATLVEAGAVVTRFTPLPDHAPVAAADLARLTGEAAASGAQALVLTEKDAVKAPAGPVLEVPVYALRVGLTFTSAAAQDRLHGVLAPLANPAPPGVA
jgi:tetraacyldisaccharide 4'-kinase